MRIVLVTTCTCVLLAALSAAAPLRAQNDDSPEGPSMALEALVRDAVQQIGARYSRPIGQVIERRRGRVFVVVDGAPPEPGTRLLASRPSSPTADDPERLIATLEVEQAKGGLIECKEVERTSRRHTEKGDQVRVQRNPPRVLLAPCIALVDVPDVVPQVIGEWLREAMLGRMDLELADDPELERNAEAAYWSGNVVSFLAGLPGDADEVLYPSLLQTPGKLVLNLEYYSVERQRATHVDVAAVHHDAMTTAWLRAGKQRGPTPPGFRLLGTQVFPWRFTALSRSTRGVLLGVTRDSIHVLDFRYPGLRPRSALSLGPRHRVRREPYAWVLTSSALGESPEASWVLSEERDPRAIMLVQDARGPRAELAPSIEPGDWFESWWPSSWGPLPLSNQRRTDRGSPSAVAPLVGDVDGDGRTDVVWTNSAGVLLVQRSSASTRLAFRGYGDVKTVQPENGAGTRAVLWLTDPVCCGQRDRLHATQLVGEELRVAWTSPELSGTVDAMASCDLNSDGAYDLVVAERHGDTTKLYVFMALPGEQTSARGMELPPGGPR